MPERVLIVNRGEIAVRVARTLRRLDVASVAVYSADDAGAPHVRACDRAVALAAHGGGSPYLDLEQLVRVAQHEGCDAVHPGYGFLAERADAARAFSAAGITWIGPGSDAIDLLGDKIRSKETAAAAAVPVVPGLQGADVDAAAVERFVADAGLPVLLKATAGGGGKGMRRVDEPSQIAPAVDAARREAQAAFGRGELLVERMVTPARHVEVQVAVDAHGGAWAIGERECSLQRRHQKLLEESPAVCLTDQERRALHDAAVRLALAAGYRNLGTVEFLLDVSGAEAAGARPFYFLEMNARLQVEHPVTEMVHGIDLVELQLRIADGERLADIGEVPEPVGHAIEARITAERIADGPSGPRFLPATGTVVGYDEPRGPGVRVDSGIERGSEVTTSFDPLLLKVVAHGRDRAQALARLDRALAGLVVLGVETGAGFLRRLIARDEVTADRTTTTLLEELLAGRESAALTSSGTATRDRAVASLVAARVATLTEDAGPGAFARPDSWRIGRPGTTRLDLVDADDVSIAVEARVLPEGREVAVDGAPPALVPPAAGGGTTADDGPWTWLRGTDGTWSWRDAPEAPGGPAGAAGGLAAPLPGVVLAVRVAVGDAVVEGQSRVVRESMKMELDVAAPHDGTVTALDVAVGDHVARGQVLAAVEAQA